MAANGGVASASSTYTQPGVSYPVSAINNNERAGVNWGTGGGWNDATADTFPDWVQINFNGNKTIDHVVIYTVQDNYVNPVEPTDTTMFTLYGVTAFTVQGWTGSTWTTLATVTGNNLVKRTVNFTPYTTSRIRINITSALASYSRITEVESWGVDAATTNVALASNGGTASASSTYSASYPVSSINNNERAGANWGNG
ncbi:MAG: discoidin domain-containing protein, partial [bacterium]